MIFGHTHRRGGPGARGRGPALWNVGSWVHSPGLLGETAAVSPYWPGTAVPARRRGRAGAPPPARRPEPRAARRRRDGRLGCGEVSLLTLPFEIPARLVRRALDDVGAIARVAREVPARLDALDARAEAVQAQLDRALTLGESIEQHGAADGRARRAHGAQRARRWSTIGERLADSRRRGRRGARRPCSARSRSRSRSRAPSSASGGRSIGSRAAARGPRRRRRSPRPSPARRRRRTPPPEQASAQGSCDIGRCAMSGRRLMSRWRRQTES